MRRRFLLAVWVLMLSLNMGGTISAQEVDYPVYREVLRIERDGPAWKREEFDFNADSTRIAAPDSTITASVWDTITGERLLTLTPDIHMGSMLTVADWNPNDEMILTAGFTGSVQIFDTETDELLTNYDAPEAYYAAWNPAGTLIASAVGTRLTIWDVVNDETFTGDELWAGITDVDWSPDGTMLFTVAGHEADYIHLWSAEGERLDTYWGGQTAAWSPDSTRLASDRQIRAIDTGLPVVIIPELTGTIVWHPDGDWLFSAQDGIHIWDTQTGALLHVIDTGNCGVDAIAFSHDGQKMATNCRDESAHRNDLIIWERTN